MRKIEQLYRLIWLSRPLMQAAEACVERGLDGTSLTVRMRAILEILSAHGSATVPDLAMRLEIKRQYVQLMVNETLAEGLTVARPNPRHKRSTLIALTPKGQGLIEEVVAREKRLLEQMGTDMDERDIVTALKLVETLIGKLKTHSGEQFR
ncbi:MarR family transcriptional regulator [Peteryoungia desertarenae]|uniref:MarR family transcriptional regulator n=1 Tax=Peteryoungia desertarenae TaxID=1813451 RepID=A0ABX6QNW3_9HYPH|nr:MarR family transcriptional regulator [Peteryoungia desertarenae]QLF69850.1 MarR family transcriptional regulator [Peteryoungia desertarenae]